MVVLRYGRVVRVEVEKLWYGDAVLVRYSELVTLGEVVVRR